MNLIEKLALLVAVAALWALGMVAIKSAPESVDLGWGEFKRDQGVWVLELPSPGFKQGLVASSSMEPAIVMGATVFVREVPVLNLAAGDVVAFQSQVTVVVHRIVEVGTDRHGWYVVTRGDANDEVDPRPWREVEFVGKVEVVIQPPVEE